MPRRLTLAAADRCAQEIGEILTVCGSVQGRLSFAVSPTKPAFCSPNKGTSEIRFGTLEAVAPAPRLKIDKLPVHRGERRRDGNSSLRTVAKMFETGEHER